MNIADPIQDVHGVGESQAQKFAILGVHTIRDLLFNFPRKYDDYSNLQKINRLKPGSISIEATIDHITGRYVRRGLHITEAIASDKTGSVRLLWFNQPYRLQSMTPKRSYYISGTYGLHYQHFTIENPSTELTSAFPINTARIVPIYRETKGLTSRQIRKALKNVITSLSSLGESLPSWIIAQFSLLTLEQAIYAIHFPDSDEQLRLAKHRLAFEEVFQLSLASLLNKQENQRETAIQVPFQEKLAKKFVSQLPFLLTDTQRKVIWQIYLDMQKNEPMNRLLEGDVGSGKTVVATMAALMVAKQNWQVAIMAPTELLARQHEETFKKLLKPLGIDKQVGLLTGSLSKNQKSSLYKSIASGKLKFIIGTHALIQENVDMDKLALVVIDEQHRFGVQQRKSLMSKAGHMPHVLSMTATPIPRSLALTLYGELDISKLTEQPLGRKPVKTVIVSPNSYAQLVNEINSHITGGSQMFVVCPLIADSDSIKSKSAEQIFQQFKTKDFKQWRVGLLHGKLSNQEKVEVMSKFVSHELDILVSTTVIEVGVDVSNAGIMLIESPDRFGLAQIHQLRGRVGRSEKQGYCYLLLDDSNPPGRRLRALTSSNDGFKLAELDLQLRGPGAIYGTSQHGLLDLRIASLSDESLISKARLAAQQFIERDENLLHYKHLMSQITRLRAVTNLN